MVAKHFEVGDLVWAKMKGFPHWPGEISAPKNDKVKKYHHFVYFYGSDNYAWIPDENIELHNETLEEKYTRDQKRSQIYLNAVEKLILASQGNPKYLKKFQISYEDEDALSSKIKSLSSGSVSKKSCTKKPSFGSKRASSDYHPLETCSYDMSPKRQKDDYSPSWYQSMPQTLSYFCFDGRDSTDDAVDAIPGILSRNVYKDRPKSPSIDLSLENTLLTLKEIEPTEKKIGFLGLGRLGQGMVRNLLQSGHSVTIWDRTTSKCDKFVSGDSDSIQFMGAEQAQTPSDVIMACDITFCCVSDPSVSKNLVFGNCGVLSGLQASPVTGEKKGFIEMTSLDPETSQAISQEVSLKGGRYLEAQISGTREEANIGSLCVLAAGDRSLYDDCRSCFQAMGENFSFISSEVGVASKFNIVHTMLMGNVYAAVAESLALVERLGFKQSDFLNILEHGDLKSDMVLEKCRSMIQNHYKSDTPLKHIQKNLSFALTLGSSIEQPMPIAAAANEMYKHCKLLRYGDHDVSAVYEGTKR